MEHTENHEEKKEIMAEAAPAGSAPKARRDWFLPVSILVAAVLIGGSVVFSTLYAPKAAAPTDQGQQGAAQQPAAQTGPSAADVAKAMELTSRDVIRGNANAPVTVIEYGDYQCPFCTRYFQAIQPTLIKNYVDTGKVKFVFRDFPFLDRFAPNQNESHDAGAAAECAKDQGKFWEFHDALYSGKAADEAKGGGENDGFYSKTLFASIATQVGMNVSTFSSCFTSGKYASTTEDDYMSAAKAGVNSTPTTFVNGVKVVGPDGNSVGADPTSIFKAIDAALKA